MVIPYLADEDEKWLNVVAHRVTTTGKTMYTDLCTIIRNTLNSPRELKKHIQYVKSRESKPALDDDEAEEEDAELQQSENHDYRNLVMKEAQSGEETPPMLRQKEMRQEHTLGMLSDPMSVIEQSSRKPTPGNSPSPKQLKIDTRPLADRVKDYYDEMIAKVREGEEATDRWRRERNMMEYIKSPTNVVRPMAFDDKFI